jgi:branched-chain amino acid aminotransferase
MVGDGKMGPITSALHTEFFAIVNGLRPDRYNWLTPVKVKAEEHVSA